MTVLAVIGATALWLLYGWLGSTMIASFLSNRKGWGDRPGLASGLLLAVGGPLIFLVAPPSVRLPRELDPERSATDVREERLPLKWPVGRVSAFWIVSLGFYGYYWFGVARQHVSQALRKGDDHPGWQTLGMAIPVVNVGLTYVLWRDVDRLRRSVGLESIPVVPYLVIALVPLVGQAIAYTRVLGALNEYWDARTDGRAVEMPASRWEYGAVAVAPGLALAYLVFGVLL